MNSHAHAPANSLERSTPRRYSAEQVLGAFSIEQIHEADEYQCAHQNNPSVLINNPLPPTLIRQNADTIGYLINNAAIYEADLENDLKEDPVLITLGEQRGFFAKHDPTGFVQALRARRTVKAIILQHSSEKTTA